MYNGVKKISALMSFMG